MPNLLIPKHKLLIQTAVYLGGILISILFPHNIKAQSISFSISPPIVEAVVKPGHVFEQTYTLTNNGNETVVSADIYPFTPADDWGNVRLQQSLSEYDPFNLKYWFNFVSPKIPLGGTFLLKSGEAADVRLRIEIPENAYEGDYYLTLVFASKPQGIYVDQGPVSQAKIGTNLLITVTGGTLVNRDFKIGNFSSPKLIDSFSPLDFRLVFTNSSPNFVKPKGKITITSWFGKKSLIISPVNVLGKSERSLTCLDGERLIPCQIPRGFLLGVYKARVDLKIDGVDKTFSAEATTIALPVYFILAFGLTLFVGGLVKKINKKKKTGKK